MTTPDPLRIIALDPKRLPVIRKEPYIELYFELSEEAPQLWREDYNARLNKNLSRPRVEADDGKYIRTWVRKPAEIAPHLKLMQKTAEQSNQQAVAAALERLAVQEGDEGSQTVSKDQVALNAAILALDFGEQG